MTNKPYQMEENTQLVESLEKRALTKPQMILVLLQVGKTQDIETESKQLISFYSFTQITPRNWNVKMTNWHMFWPFFSDLVRKFTL